VTHSSLGLIVVGAGSSHRMGGVDKVWAPLGDHPIVWHSLQRLAPLAAATVLVVRADQAARAADLTRDLPNVIVALGGAERQGSVLNGLAALPALDIVAVHDAARPFASASLLERGLAGLQTWSAAIPATPVVDTIKTIDDHGRIMSTVNRENLRAVQTPQIFWTAALHRAHEHGVRTGLAATDDAALLEAAGFPVYTYEGEVTNFKITTEHDLTLARLLLAHQGVR
jgi:2-C-methyl-D-erythritol 4-phosphate cytidylyltransferase